MLVEKAVICFVISKSLCPVIFMRPIDMQVNIDMHFSISRRLVYYDPVFKTTCKRIWLCKVFHLFFSCISLNFTLPCLHFHGMQFSLSCHTTLITCYWKFYSRKFSLYDCIPLGLLYPIYC